MADFTFCPGSLVPETLTPDTTDAVSLNGWSFSARPSVPFQRKFKVTLHGLSWYLNAATNLYDSTTNPTKNARALELFYQTHQTWKSFNWTHPHLGLLVCKFAQKVEVPAAIPDSGGFIEPLTITLVENNPAFT